MTLTFFEDISFLRIIEYKRCIWAATWAVTVTFFRERIIQNISWSWEAWNTKVAYKVHLDLSFYFLQRENYSEHILVLRSMEYKMCKWARTLTFTKVDPLALKSECCWHRNLTEKLKQEVDICNAQKFTRTKSKWNVSRNWFISRYGLLSFNPFWEQETQVLKISQKKTQPGV